MSSESDPSVFKIALQPVERFVVDNPDEMPGRACIGSQQFLEADFQFFKELIFDFFVDHKVVRCDAGLPRVEALSPGDALRCDLDVGVLVHDARTLTSEFQHDRRKVLRRRSHHDSAKRRASGEEYEVPAFLQQS